MEKRLKIMHLTTHLGGGVGRVVLNYLNLAKNRSKFEHDIFSLDYINEKAKKNLDELNIHYEQNCSNSYDKLIKSIESYDIVLIHWWNHPLMYEFLVKHTLQSARVIMWSHISGLYHPSNFTKPLFKYADKFVFTTPISYESKMIEKLSKKKKEKLSVIWSTAGVAHVKDLKSKPHNGFNIGYLGTVDYSKIHKDFLDISSKVDIDNSHFIVCGGEDEKKIEKEALSKDIKDRFEFTGQIDDIKAYLEKFDVFGYPLSPYHFGTCDQVLAEAMACGIVPIVFDNPMEKNMVQDNITGLVVSSADEYISSIKRLYKDKELLKKLSINAKSYALSRFSLETMFKQWEELFNKVMNIEKNTKYWDSKYSGKSTDSFEIFLESTGEYADDFEKILYTQDRETHIQKIKNVLYSTNGWNSNSKGTLHQYARFFKDNNKLNLLKGYLAK